MENNTKKDIYDISNFDREVSIYKIMFQDKTTTLLKNIIEQISIDRFEGKCRYPSILLVGRSSKRLIANALCNSLGFVYEEIFFWISRSVPWNSRCRRFVFGSSAFKAWENSNIHCRGDYIRPSMEKARSASHHAGQSDHCCRLLFGCLPFKACLIAPSDRNGSSGIF